MAALCGRQKGAARTALYPVFLRIPGTLAAAKACCRPCDRIFSAVLFPPQGRPCQFVQQARSTCW